MRTRTLLILAVACGLVILVAGSLQLLRFGDTSDAIPDLRVGDTATAGDLTVTVVSAAEADGRMQVVVRTSGVDDPLGFDGFELLAPPVRLPARGETGAQACRELTVAEQSCTLTYDTSGASRDGARVLLVRRGEDQRRWVLG
jgi:DNA-binding transcriptional regulator of glucitol operon